MKAHLIDTHLLVPRSRSSAKVKVRYQGHVSQKMGVFGALVFHKHILFYINPLPRMLMLDSSDSATNRYDVKNMNKWRYNYLRKTLWEKKKVLGMSNFSFPTLFSKAICC